MEVTSDNFKEVLPKIEATINNATFLAIDCEFSGLNVIKEVNAYDTPQQYYEKVRKNCKDFLVLQYGLSCFRYDSESGSFKQQSYNFYIFRRPINRNINDQRFLCQTSSIHFLITQGFDFNKLFKNGISYLNCSEEESFREKLDEKFKNKTQAIHTPKQEKSDAVQVPDNMKQAYKDIMKQIDQFLKSEKDELDVPKLNAFMRRLIYQTVHGSAKYKDKLTLQTKMINEKDRVLNVTKFKSRKEQENLLKKEQDEELVQLDDFIGFTKVLKLIVDSGKLVVGHNMYLDFLHTIDKFLTPLPAEYEEFKQCAHSLFKKVLDTKFMSSSDEFSELIPSTALKDMLDTVAESPFKMPPVEIEEGGQGYDLKELKEHEAGFDAYMTGLSFIGMWNYLGNGEKVDFVNFKLIESYINKIMLFMLRDNVYFNLAGADPKPSRNHVFYVTFPREWNTNNIVALFSPFGGVFVAWISESSAYVGLFKKDQAKVALSTLSQSDTYSIMPYAKRQAELENPCLNRRKRSYESPSNNDKSKKLKTDILNADSGCSKEEERVESESNRQKIEPKTFVESDAWE